MRSATTLDLDWTAGDDEGLSRFELQATYGGGRTWHTLVGRPRRRHPHYDWHMPPAAAS
ncbi:MAG: hypothetical protein R3F17_05460 [Planctomycetota bacterium]